MMSADPSGCIFCHIVRRKAEAFIVHEDELCMAFLDLRQVREGHTMVIPKDHVDHFMDLDQNLSAHILETGQRIARKIRSVLNPPRVGYVVAGFGVPHVHLHIIPMWEEHDITSAQYLDGSKTPPVFDVENIPIRTEESRRKTCNLIRLA
ncbi:MAG: HIT family protein [Rhodospirillales bacterium]|nr:HIT family protein [Rhodospirillales bacterium]